MSSIFPLPRAVRELRAHVGCTGEELGRLINEKRPVSKQTVSFWEDGTHKPSDVRLIELKNLAVKTSANAEIVASLEAAIESAEARPS